MRRPLGHNYSQKNQMFSRAHEDKNVSTVMLFLLFKCCFEDRSVVQTILIFFDYEAQTYVDSVVKSLVQVI